MRKSYTHPVLLFILCISCITMACNKNNASSDDLTGNWSTAADFKGDARGEASSFVINDIAYVLTGASIGGTYSDMYAFDVNNGSWTKKAPLPALDRNSAVAFAINGKGYIGTGYHNDEKNSYGMKDFWEYDPVTDAWKQKDSLPGESRLDAAVFVIGNKAYVCGGYNNLKAYNDCFEFDPAAGPDHQWTEKASFPHKTYKGVAFTLNNKGYLVTGTNNAEVQKELYEYDADQNLWSTKRPLYNYSDQPYDDKYTTITRQNAVAFLLDKYAYIATGSNNSLLTSTWRYNADDDTWKEYTGFEARTREGAVAFTVKNRAFVLTGQTGSLFLDNMFEFNPNATKVDND